MSSFGGELTRLMEAHGIGVRALARQVHYNPGHISNLRNGKAQPSPESAQELDDALGAGGTLAALANAATARSAGGIAQRDSTAGARVVDRALLMRLNALSPLQVDELIDHLDGQWHALVKTDNLLGPRHALGTVQNHLAVITALLRVTRSPTRREVLHLAARYAESAAWLHEDSGDMPGASYW